MRKTLLSVLLTVGMVLPGALATSAAIPDTDLNTGHSIILTGGEKLPAIPADATNLGEKPLAQCGENFGVYYRTWDLNPNTKAAIQEYGSYERRDGVEEVTFNSAVMYIISDDEGAISVLLNNRGKLESFPSVEALVEVYPDPCSLPINPVSEKVNIQQK